MDPLLILLGAVAIIFVYVKIGSKMVERVFDDTQDSDAIVKALRRSYMCAFWFGVGAIGVEGFGFPAPAFLGVVGSMIIGAPTVVHSLIGFAASWFLLFFFFLVKDNRASRAVRYSRGRRNDQIDGIKRRPWIIFVGTILGIGALMILFTNVITFLSVDRVTVRRSLYPYSELIPAAVDHVWRKDGRLPCQADELHEYVRTPSDTKYPIRLRVNGCGHYIVEAVDRRGRLAGTLLLKVRSDNTASEVSLKWNCVGTTYGDGIETYNLECESKRTAKVDDNNVRNSSSGNMVVTANDFLALVGDDWSGQLRQYDENDNLLENAEARVSVNILSAREVQFSYSSPDKPHPNSESRVSISEDGRLLDGGKLIDRTTKDDGILRLVSLSEIERESDSSRIRRIYLISEKTFDLRTIFSDVDTEAETTEFTFKR